MHGIDGGWRTASRGMADQSAIYECGRAYIFLGYVFMALDLQTLSSKKSATLQLSRRKFKYGSRVIVLSRLQGGGRKIGVIG